MRSLLAFMKKEWMEQFRSGHIVVLAIVFVLVGIMNPATAKLTPWLMERFADSLEGSGIIITEVTVTAMDSWMQFFKNIPLTLIVFILLQSNLFTKEYQSGTLVPVLTKGLARYKVVVSKTAVLLVLWTVGYGLCAGITYGYTMFFWDNSITRHLVFSMVCWWLFGVGTVLWMVFFSTAAQSNVAVLAGTGGMVLLYYLLGMIPSWAEYVPTQLTNGYALVCGMTEVSDYMAAIGITVGLGVVCFAAGIRIFNKKSW